MRHIPVLLAEVLKTFEGKRISIFFEGTVGAGGHAQAILEAHPEIEKYFACDRDPSALKIAKETLKPWWEKVEWVQGAFAEMVKKAPPLDGFLIDIGVSSMQFDEGARGFSFRSDAPLDMRMDPDGVLTAERIVNEYPEVELARIFYEYGEEFRSRAAAKAIVMARKKRPIRTTHELVAVVEQVLRKGKIHPATKIFQALRIVVNDELGQLERGLDAAIGKMAPGGLLAVISFHSLEDRIVKWKFRQDERVEILTKKPIGPTREEVGKNARSRSAKLRAAERV